MLEELSKSLFPAFLLETLSIGVAILFRERKGFAFLLFAVGTLLSFYVGYQNYSVVESEPETQSTVFYETDFRLQSEVTGPETNLGLTPGQHFLAEIPFRLGWKASTQCSHLPARPEYITIDGLGITNASNVYLLLQAGWAREEFYEKAIGSVNMIFEYQNGLTIFDTYLTIGENIRDWTREQPNAVSTLNSSNVIPDVWTGSSPEGESGGIDILKISVPPEYSVLPLVSIQISDASQAWVNDIDPCVHLLALTIEAPEQELR